MAAKSLVAFSDLNKSPGLESGTVEVPAPEFGEGKVIHFRKKMTVIDYMTLAVPCSQAEFLMKMFACLAKGPDGGNLVDDNEVAWYNNHADAASIAAVVIRSGLVMDIYNQCQDIEKALAESNEKRQKEYAQLSPKNKETPKKGRGGSSS